MTYCVVEKPCPDCGGAGFQSFKAVGPGWDDIMEVNCGRCFATGWIEDYRYIDGEDGSQRPVEIPNPPDAPRTGSGYADIPLPVGAY